jgi:hypothetical protein
MCVIIVCTVDLACIRTADWLLASLARRRGSGSAALAIEAARRPVGSIPARRSTVLPDISVSLVSRVVDSSAVGRRVGGADEFAARAPSYVCRAGQFQRKQWS